MLPISFAVLQLHPTSRIIFISAFSKSHHMHFLYAVRSKLFFAPGGGEEGGAARGAPAADCVCGLF